VNVIIKLSGKQTNTKEVIKVMIKILNLYAGIGGNRKLWAGDIEVTAVEINQEIANIYKDIHIE
jgi:hypothetical protein